MTRMTPQQVEEFISEARTETRARMQSASSEFGLGSWQRFELDLASTSLHFFDEKDVARATAHIQAAGSWSSSSQSWLWSWENDSVPKPACARLDVVKAFGVRHDLAFLCAGFNPCDEGTAWSMASVAAHLLRCASLYSVPTKSGRLFLLLFELRNVTQ